MYARPEACGRDLWRQAEAPNTSRKRKCGSLLLLLLLLLLKDGQQLLLLKDGKGLHAGGAYEPYQHGVGGVQGAIYECGCE